MNTLWNLLFTEVILHMNDMAAMFKRLAVDAVEADKPADIFFGTVTSVTPLEIQTDQKIILNENMLILTDNVRDIERDITVSMVTEKAYIPGFVHNHGYSGTTSREGYYIDDYDYVHSHTYRGTTDTYGDDEDTLHNHIIEGKKKIILHNGLKSGENVILLRCRYGQKYVVLDRVSNYEAVGQWYEDSREVLAL